MSDNADNKLTIEIHNPSALPLIDYHKVKPLQGDLKDLTESNYNKLLNRLKKRGFRIPLFIWLEQGIFGEGEIYKHYWLMDGHQRQRVMIREDIHPYQVPYILIEASTLQEAKEMLLEITSQYGTITQEGLDEFTAEFEAGELEDITFDALPTFSHETLEKKSHSFPEIKPAIVIYFGDKSEMEDALIEIQDLCEKYTTADITTNEKD